MICSALIWSSGWWVVVRELNPGRQLLLLPAQAEEEDAP